MRTTLKRMGILLLSLLLVATASGAKPKLASEAEAKEAGLALINQVFDITETEATVTLSEWEGFSYVNGEEQQTGKEENAFIYVVSVHGKDVKANQYQAAVNVKKTGVAFRAERSEQFLTPLTNDQQNEAKELASMDNADEAYVKKLNESNASEIVTAWAAERLHPDFNVMAVLDNGYITDSVITP